MPNQRQGASDPEVPHGPIVRDRRRIDPKTGAVREPSEGSAPGQAAQAAVAGVAKARAVREAAKAAAHGGSGGRGQDGEQPDEDQKAKPAAPAEDTATEVTAMAGRISELESTVAERTGDLQRVQAEYANYRKRVERDRVSVRELAIADTLSELLSVLDDIGRAREHGELEGGFKSVGEALEQTVGKLGLEKFGEVGEPFDPTRHEAFLHSYDDDVEEPVCSAILQPGYQIKDRIVRPARVAVTEPTPYDPTGGKTTRSQQTSREESGESGESGADTGKPSPDQPEPDEQPD